MLIRFFAVLIIMMFPICSVNADETLFKTGVSYVEQVNTNFFGAWRVKSLLKETDSPSNFKKNTVDIWNISKEGNVINVKNPFSGAKASVSLNFADNNTVEFTKISNYEGKRLTDTVKIIIDGDMFLGENIILLETFSDVDNSLIKSITATYKLTGEKISQ